MEQENMTAEDAIRKAMEKIEELRDKNQDEIGYMIEHNFKAERMFLQCKEDTYRECRGVLFDILHRL